MFTRSLEESRRELRGGQASYLLVGRGDFGSRHLAVTWVEGGAGSEQRRHAHPESEQVYVVVRGNGRMKVGDEERLVGPGTAVFVPPGALHAIAQVGDEPLVYVSATAPPFEAPPDRWKAPGT